MKKLENSGLDMKVLLLLIIFLTACCAFIIKKNQPENLGSPLLLPQTAGTKDGDQHIVGGTRANLGEYPYQGLLIVKRNILCGCVLIDSEWVLTAAHCTIDDKNVKALPSELEVTFGIIDRISLSSDSQIRSVRAIYNHEGFNRTPSNNIGDISLLQLSSPIIINSYVAPISLPFAGNILTDVDQTSCSITGWGRLSSNSQSASQYLRQAFVPIVTNTVCNEWYSNGTAAMILDEHVCAGFEQGGVSTCNGDSGGPLACRSTSTGRWTLVGLTSFGVVCAAPQQPGVFTRVSTFASWITGILVASPGAAAGLTQSQLHFLPAALMVTFGSLMISSNLIV